VRNLLYSRDNMLPRSIKLLVITFCCGVLTFCSPRDFLTRRLAADLISASETFKAQQQFVLTTGTVSNKDYSAPEYLVLQHHGWISGTLTRCPQNLAPPPCWDILLTPSGVDTVRALVAPEETAKPSFSIPGAKRELIEIVGISKQGNLADVDFSWKWAPLNEVGEALYSSDVIYKSTVGFRNYDDGWHLIDTAFHSGQSLDEALKNAEPAP
jgi:hypothetical protein